MLELDFAYFSLINYEKKGLAARKSFLEMLTPIFFKPRLERLIEIRDIEAKGCNIIVPLGQGNFNALNRNLQENLVSKSLNIINDYNIHYMAVDRNLKQYLQKLAAEFSLVFGDNFIKALTNVIIAETLSQHEMQKIVVIGEIEGFEEFLEVVASYELPLSIQNYNPRDYEIMSYRMLYERGCAISNSYITPKDWEPGDMIVNLNQDEGQLTVGSPSLCYFEFTNNQINMAPRLEESLRNSGINPGIHSLAPILETCLLTKAGFSGYNEEHKEANETTGQSFLQLQEAGEKLGLWELFLDKGF